jgi:hypothetical protein
MGLPETMPRTVPNLSSEGLAFRMAGVWQFFNQNPYKATLDLFSSNHLNVVNLKIIIENTSIL